MSLYPGFFSLPVSNLCYSDFLVSMSPCLSLSSLSVSMSVSALQPPCLHVCLYIQTFSLYISMFVSTSGLSFSLHVCLYIRVVFQPLSFLIHPSLFSVWPALKSVLAASSSPCVCASVSLPSYLMPGVFASYPLFLS